MLKHAITLLRAVIIALPEVPCSEHFRDIGAIINHQQEDDFHVGNGLVAMNDTVLVMAPLALLFHILYS